MVQSLREQLEISTGRGKELAGVVSLAAASGIPSLATPDAYVALLRLVRPTAFQSFRGYVQWRTGTAGVVLASMQHAVETSWVTKNGEKGPPAARRLLATLKGSLRRMDVREADDYDEAEHAECAAAVAAAAAGLAAHCRPPLTLPWGLRAQLAEVLLRGIFDSLDESAVVPEAQQLLGLLQREVWPQLGVSPAMHQALLTWAYYRQYTASNEVQLLESAAGMAQRIGSIAGSGGGDGLTPDAAFASQVLASLGAQAVASLSDYHGAMKNVRQLKAMLALLEAVEAARGQSQGVPALLEQCIDASLGAAFGRKAAEIGENVPVEEDRVALLATETAEMLKAECAEYTPVLAARLPGARAVAAATLHRLFGARLLPWLLSGKLMKHVSPPHSALLYFCFVPVLSSRHLWALCWYH